MVKKLLRSPIVTVALFALAVALILGGGVGGARARLTIESTDYFARVELTDIETGLIENGNLITDGKLLTKFPPDGQEFKVGQTYKEELGVENVGTIDQYTRVTVYKYWVSADGTRLTTLEPDYIDLHFTEGNGWIEDTSARTAERRVFYYDHILPVGDNTAATPLTDTLTIKNDVLTCADSAAYQGATFQIEAVVDAVQTHSADQAMVSAWGRTYNGQTKAE